MVVEATEDELDYWMVSITDKQNVNSARDVTNSVSDVVPLSPSTRDVVKDAHLVTRGELGGEMDVADGGNKLVDGANHGHVKRLAVIAIERIQVAINVDGDVPKERGSS